MTANTPRRHALTAWLLAAALSAASARMAGARRLVARFGAAHLRTLRAVGLLVVGLASGCDDGCCWLQMSPGHWYSPVPGESWNSLLEDTAGLAGLQIDVRGRTFVAKNFLDARDNEVRVKVGRAGRVSVAAKLVHGDSVVADGVASWLLEPETLWSLRIMRGPGSVGCPGRCDEYVVIPIAEAAVRYPGEALWLSWTAWPHDPDPNIIYRDVANAAS